MTNLLQILQDEPLYEGQIEELLLPYLLWLTPKKKAGELLTLIRFLIELSDMCPMETNLLLRAAERRLEKVMEPKSE
jgi:hypothetical protein